PPLRVIRSYPSTWFPLTTLRFIIPRSPSKIVPSHLPLSQLESALGGCSCACAKLLPTKRITKAIITLLVFIFCPSMFESFSTSSSTATIVELAHLVARFLSKNGPLYATMPLGNDLLVLR